MLRPCSGRWFLGWVLLAMGVMGLVSLVAHMNANAYAMGNLTGGVLFVLLGVWLIRSGRSSLRS